MRRFALSVSAVKLSGDRRTNRYRADDAWKDSYVRVRPADCVALPEQEAHAR